MGGRAAIPLTHSDRAARVGGCCSHRGGAAGGRPPPRACSTGRTWANWLAAWHVQRLLDCGTLCA
eukprot:4283744-Prymnesium_polylepis.1